MSLYSEASPEAFLHGVFQEDEDNVKNRHQWMYTESSLCRLMSQSGFVNVNECTFRSGRLPDLERIDNRPDNSIYIEGEKLPLESSHRSRDGQGGSDIHDSESTPSPSATRLM